MTTVKKKENIAQTFDDLKESEDLEKKVFSQKNNTKDKLKKFRGEKKVFFYLLTGILFLAGISVYYLLIQNEKNVWIPQLKWFTIQNPKSVKFEPFIIPFKEHGKYTYISLSISFEMPNKELMDEMIEKNSWIRGVIYNILSENIYILENISSLIKLKTIIINSVNKVLTSGKVEKAIITDFSTV